METDAQFQLGAISEMLDLVTTISVPNLFLYQKGHNLPEISSYAAGLILRKEIQEWRNRVVLGSIISVEPCLNH